MTTMSAPFYTSEKLESDNPKWSEIEVGDLTCHVNAAVNGMCYLFLVDEYLI